MSDSRFAEMISKIAHELRSPLTSVKGFSATLISRWERFSDQQRYELIEAIHADAERMGRIVSEVLDLARLEADRLELHRQTVEVEALIDRAIENVSSLPGAERISKDVSPELVCSIDPDRMHHVFFNLLENAVKFSDEGEIRIRAERSNGEVIVEVEDSGVGIPADRIDEIFEGPGPTGQSATPRGTGLGLYLSRGLVELHGGSIRVSSTEGSGSSFVVSLPVGSR